MDYRDNRRHSRKGGQCWAPIGGQLCAPVDTGSTRGIGLAIARAFQDHGAKVVISSEDADDCTRIGQEMDMLAIPADVTDARRLAVLVDGTVDHYGGIDILVCNAGITGQPGPFATIAMDD